MIKLLTSMMILFLHQERCSSSVDNRPLCSCDARRPAIERWERRWSFVWPTSSRSSFAAVSGRCNSRRVPPRTSRSSGPTWTILGLFGIKNLYPGTSIFNSWHLTTYQARKVELEWCWPPSRKTHSKVIELAKRAKKSGLKPNWVAVTNEAPNSVDSFTTASSSSTFSTTFVTNLQKSSYWART